MTSKKISIYIELKEGKRSDNTRKCMLFALGCFCLLPSAYLHCKNMRGGFVLIIKSAWGVLSTLNYWVWGVLSAFKKTWWFLSTYNKMDVGCFVLHSLTSHSFSAVALIHKYKQLMRKIMLRNIKHRYQRITYVTESRVSSY